MKVKLMLAICAIAFASVLSAAPKDIGVRQAGPWIVVPWFGQMAHAQDATPTPTPAPTVAPTPDPTAVLNGINIPTPPTQTASWIQGLVNWLDQIPGVGKYLAMLFSALAAASGLATIIASALLAISKALDALGDTIPWLVPLSNFIQAINQWFLYISMYNVQTTPEGKRPPFAVQRKKKK